MKRFILPAWLILAGLVAGCFGSGKNPVKATPSQPFTYSRATPQDVLTSLVHAYNARDSSAYAKLYAPAYQGVSYDTSGAQEPQPGMFTRADEVAHIKALAQDRSILSVTLNLGAPGSWARTAAKGPGEEDWAEIPIYNPRLQIDTATSSLVLASNEMFVFDFSFETPAPSSPTDTLWSIVRWSETASGP